MTAAGLTRDEALRLLRDTERYCEGAEALAALGDRQALMDLAEAYLDLEDVPKRCLIEAIQALDGAEAAASLFVSNDAEARRAAVLVMRLAPDERHLPLLENALEDTDSQVRWHARQALAAQPRTQAWEDALLRILETGDPAGRERAADYLSGRRSERVRTALERRAVEEHDEDVRSAIARALEV